MNKQIKKQCMGIGPRRLTKWNYTNSINNNNNSNANIGRSNRNSSNKWRII